MCSSQAAPATSAASPPGSWLAPVCIRSCWITSVQGFSPTLAGDVLLPVIIADAPLLRRRLREEAIDAVVHFAACAYVGESMRMPRHYFRNNVSGSLNLLDAMLDAGVRHIVFSSTCATYGLPEWLPLDEAHPQRPVNPYGESKLFVERALRWYGEAYGLNWVVLRYFNVAERTPNASWASSMSRRPIWFRWPYRRRSAAALTSTSMEPTIRPPTARPCGTTFIHRSGRRPCSSAALSHRERCKHRSEPGHRRGYSVHQIIQAVERVSGRSVPVIEAPRRQGDPPELVADPRAAAEILGLARPVERSGSDHLDRVEVARSRSRGSVMAGYIIMNLFRQSSVKWIYLVAERS